MKASETFGWKFAPTRPEDSSEVQCPECGEWSALAQWENGSIECETCGDHNTMECPRCGHDVDHIHQWEPLNVRPGPNAPISVADASKVGSIVEAARAAGQSEVDVQILFDAAPKKIKISPETVRSMVRVSELTGAQLDYWVAKAAGIPCTLAAHPTHAAETACYVADVNGDAVFQAGPWRPSTKWEIGGPIIEREGISPMRWEVPNDDGTLWTARNLAATVHQSGPTALTAAMRSYVASKFGDEVPES